MSYSWFVKALVASQSAKNGISSTGPSLFNFDITVDGAVITKANVSSLLTTTTSLDAADLVNGYYTTTSGWSSGTHNLTLSDVSDIIDAIPNCQDGSSFKFTINNTSGQSIALVVGASGVTLGSGVGTVATATVRTFLVVVTRSEIDAVTVYLM